MSEYALSVHGHPYNFKRSEPRPGEPVADVATIPTLEHVDPRGHLPNVYDQGQLGSCTANAVAAAVEYDVLLDNPLLRGNSRPRPSRLFVYYLERQLEGTLGQGDVGAYGHDGFKACATFGWVRERDWPYDITRYAVKPNEQVWENAKARLLKKPVHVVPQDIDSVKAVLSNRQTVAFGFDVYESFEYPEVMDSGVVPMPEGSLLGGHEILMVGYLADYPDHVLCRNSWGRDVYRGLEGADKHGGGYLLMPWEYVLDASLASDFRTIVRPVGA